MRIDHVAIYVKNMEAEKNFFEKYFNAKAGSKYTNFRNDFSNYFLEFKDGSMLEIMNRASMVDPKKMAYRSGFHHIGISVGDRKDVDDLTKRMQEDGCVIISGARATGDRHYASVVLDPEGNEIEILAEGTVER